MHVCARVFFQAYTKHDPRVIIPKFYNIIIYQTKAWKLQFIG